MTRRARPGGFLQTFTDLTAIDADISQFPIAETAQHGKSRLPFSLGDHGDDESLHEIKEPPPDAEDRVPGVGVLGVMGTAVQ